MPFTTNLIQLEELANNAGPSQIQNVFNILISELRQYLELEPVNKNVEICLTSDEIYERNNEESILDSGVIRTSVNSALKIEIIDHYSHFLRLILLREAYYCFIPPVARESITVKICINQIVENDLERMALKNELKEWHSLVRDTLVNKDFIDAQLDRLKKYFKTETFGEHQPDTIQHLFTYIHENPMSKYNFDEFYDIIFEDYSFKTSRSLLNPEIIETLKILIKIFYDTKSYLSLTDYQTLFKNYKEKKLIETDLSLRRFTENLKWINKCSAIAPSYDYSYSIIGFYAIVVTLKFNPLLEKGKIKKVIDNWPFYFLSKLSTNSFALGLSITFHVPRIYVQDFIEFFNKLAEDGYIIEKRLICLSNKVDALNLNYHTDISNMAKIIDPHNINYNKSYEIECITDYPEVSTPKPLSIFNYTIIERVRSVSVTGLTFDKRIETLNAIKEDVENEIRNQNIINERFKDSLEKVINSHQLKHQFLEFIEKNMEHGLLFSYSQLRQILDFLEVLEKILNYNPHISNIHMFQEFLNSDLGPKLIEEQILLRNDKLRRIIARDFLPLYFQSKESFRKELEKVETFYNVLDTCYNLKILEFDQIKKIIEKPHLAEEIYNIREKKYNSIFRPFSEYKITNEKIEDTIETLLHHKPPLLKPLLINTILTGIFSSYYPEIVLEDTPEVYDKINKLKSYFPRMYINRTIELITNRNIIRVLIYSVHIKEKSLLLSILYSRFRRSLIYYKRFFWGGVSRRVRYGVRDFYDFEKGGFHYSKDLYPQMLKLSQNIFGDKLSFPNYSIINNIAQFFWSEGKDMADLVDAEKYRISRQDIDFDPKELAALSEFIRNLEYILLDPVKFREVKVKDFYLRYIQSIEFIPAFQKFGFSQYLLYFRPFYYTSPNYKIDFRLLFANSFQNIKYPASIEPNPAIFCEYIFPFRKPNKSYLNWLVKSKKNVSEYCLFFKKKIYDVVHFNRNLTKQGLNYSAIRFKSYMQDVLFKRSYEPELLSIREFDLSEISEENFYGPDTVEFKDLTQLYNFDIKSYLGTNKYSIIDKITYLLRRKLIFPYVSLKNLDFQDKISIILPDIKEGLNEKIIKIFSFFNVSRIYEIEGDFYIYGFEKEKSFENGLLIDLWFPKCEIDEFFNVFDLLFQYLGIKHYLILTDLVKGETLLKSVYGDVDLSKSYNPLLNLKWNGKDKIWMNHKLFTEKFEPIYPDLNYGNKNNTT